MYFWPQDTTGKEKKKEERSLVSASWRGGVVPDLPGSTHTSHKKERVQVLMALSSHHPISSQWLAPQHAGTGAANACQQEGSWVSWLQLLEAAYEKDD